MTGGGERPRARDAHDDAYEASRVEEAREVSAGTAIDEECELCGARMYGLHCKLVCPNCGYRRDCSDP